MKKIEGIVFVLMCLLMVLATGCNQPLAYNINEAAAKGDLVDVQRHLKKGADVNALNKDGVTPLMLAVGAGNANLVTYLLDKGANANARNKDGITPLRIATDLKHEDVVMFLEQHGAKE